MKYDKPMTLIEELQDLYKQATTERSHYYTGNTIAKAISELQNVYKNVDELKNQLVDALKARNAAIAFAKTVQNSTVNAKTKLGQGLLKGLQEARIAELEEENLKLKAELEQRKFIMGDHYNDELREQCKKLVETLEFCTVLHLPAKPCAGHELLEIAAKTNCQAAKEAIQTYNKWKNGGEKS